MNRPRTLLPASILLGGVAWASGCGDGTTEPPQPPEPLRPAAITVSPATAQLTALGATAQLSAEVRDQNGHVVAGAAVTWTTSSAGVATVDAAGLVTAQSNGTATITATAGTVSGNSAVTVEQQVSATVVSPPEGTVSEGDTLRLAAEATDANGHPVADIVFAWLSSDTAVAAVDESGLVRGVARGTAAITATSSSMEATAQIRVAYPDWAPLVAFYEGTNGQGWIESDGWMSDRPIGQWHGVTTGPDGHVTALELPASDLAGSIPTQLGRLSHLETLDFERNQLVGPIPGELGRLQSLRSLNLGVNRLSGEIPAELGNLPSLEDLRLRRNNLSGPIPPELGNLRNLARLGVDRNGLTGPVPSAFLRLDQLRLFHFAHNPSLCVSGSAGFAAWLARLDVGIGPRCNDGDREVLASLYEATGGADWSRADGWLGDGALLEWHGVSLDSLGRVVRLDLSDNGLAGSLPGSLAQLTSMVSLDIDGNEGLSGPLPLSLPALSLQELRYADTGLCIPPDPVFGEWLAAIPSHEGPIAECEPLSERAILESLYEATGGADWTDDTNWLSDQRLGSWFGLETNDEGRVIEILLPGNNPRGYYMGIMPEPVVGGQSGVGYLGFPVNFSVADPFVIAHELGHNMSLYHAPCGGAGGPDPAFPQSNGSIGTWGYDSRADGVLISPNARDMMSYCGPPRWVSEFSFTKALDYRLASEGGTVQFAQSADGAPAQSLILWGGVDNQGSPFLEPAFVADAPPSVPRSDGEYRLVGRGARGDELFSLSFDMAELADADGRSSFVFALPVGTGWTGILESITLSGPGGATTSDQTTDLPVAILRESDSGQVRGILRGEDAMDAMRAAAEAFGPTGPRLQVLFSRGVPNAVDWRP